MFTVPTFRFRDNFLFCFLHAFLILFLHTKVKQKQEQKQKQKTKSIVGRSTSITIPNTPISSSAVSRWQKEDKKIFDLKIFLLFASFYFLDTSSCSYHFIKINLSSFVFVSLASKDTKNVKRIRSQFFRLVSLPLCFVHDSWRRWFLSQKSLELANCIVLLVTPCEQTMTRKSCSIFTGLSLVGKTHWKNRWAWLTLIMLICFLQSKKIESINGLICHF